MIHSIHKKIYLGAALLVIVAVALVFANRIGPDLNKEKHFDDVGDNNGLEGSSFEYTFNVDGVLEEAGSMDESASKYWWLDSGGMFIIQSGMGSTIQGPLPANNKWRMLYASSNSIDTDQGLHPQNIFRLLTRSQWKNFRQQMYFRIKADNMSESTNRNESNGILLLSRFMDSNNLYYAGLRVDGHAIIKKKINGTYHTLVEEPVLAGTYSRDSKMSLLPKNTWIGLRSDVMNIGDDHVKIKLFADIGQKGNWVLIADADDLNDVEDGPIVDSEGYAGVRIDFMDVDFKDYRIYEL
jgi:hypothetical protein